MKEKTWVGAALGFLLLGIGLVRAENQALAVAQPVPAGERVANYLQAYWTMLGALVEAKNSGDILSGVQTYRVVVTYDSGGKALEVSVVGMSRDSKVVQQMLDVVRKVTLQQNPKLQKNFGVTLQEKDISMDYFYAKTGDVLARYKEGHYLEGPFSSPTPEPTEVFGNPSP